MLLVVLEVKKEINVAKSMLGREERAFFLNVHV